MIKAVVTGFILLVTTATQTVWAQEQIPGLIPRFYSIEAATDLPIPPEVAHAQALEGEDISLIDPDLTTNIWNPNLKDIPNHQLLTHGESVRFVKELPSRLGQLRFTVEARGREFIVVLSKKVHNFILRRNILSKLGYKTQPMNWVSTLSVNFDSTVDRDILKSEMKDKLLAGTERWIKKEVDLNLLLQDALVLTPETDIYNLAAGLMPQTIHQGRRLLRSPYVPLALVDASESINLMSWQAGRIVLNNIKLNHTPDLENTYSTSWEDARWIGRRISKLTRADFEEIVAKAYLPKAVELLLTEKLVARRNDLLKLLDLEAKDLDFNASVTFEDKLVKGEITQEFFEGYASRFSYGDPESPFSNSEIGFFALSRVQSQVIDSAITKLNTYLGTQDQENYAEKVTEIIKDQGPFFPLQALAIPTLHGNIILSRDIVTGSYMGTNNKVQLVDNFGVSVDPGIYGGLEGGIIPFGAKAGVSLAFQRMYSHVKPIQTLKKSMKEPYKNLLVPLVIKKLAKQIDKLSTVTGNDQQIMLGSIIGDLKATLAVGESFIITDSLVPRIFGDGQISLSTFMFLDPNLLKVQAKVQAERDMLTRFHFHRVSEHVFQIYQDYGRANKLNITVKLKSYVPILSFNVRGAKTKAETHLYPISLHPRDATVEMMKALRVSLLSLNHEALKDLVKPHVIDHGLREKNNTIQLTVLKRNRIGSHQSLELTHADGGPKKKILRRYDGITAGNDYESYVTETINGLVGMFLTDQIAISQVPTLNPGFTLGGKARNRILISETDGERMTTSFQRIFNGFKVHPKKLNKFLKRINKEVGEEVFSPLAVINTDSILLYQIQFLYVLTQEGIDAALNCSNLQIRDLLTKYGFGNLEDEKILEMANLFQSETNQIRQLLVTDPTLGMKKFHRWLIDLQDFMSIKGLSLLVGKENISYQGRIDGFRQGDEGGDAAIMSNVYGELPVALQLTPSQQVMQNWGILEGELLLNWMTERTL